MRRVFFSLCLLIVSCDQKEKTSSEEKVEVETTLPSAPLGTMTEAEIRALVGDLSNESTERFVRLLHGDAAARRWAPLALGLRCKPDNVDEILPQLLGATASWSVGKEPANPDDLRTAGWAIGACATDEAEEVLRSWLTPSGQSTPSGLVEAAVLGLASIADRRGKLSERTQTAVLDAAARFERPDFLLPLGRIGRLSDAVGAHILEVTGNLLTKKDKGSRRHTIFALGSAGPSAAAPLAQVLQTNSFTAEERAAAAQALGRLGGAGQKALDESLAALLSRGLPVEYDRPLWIPLRAIFETLEEAADSQKVLAEIAAVVLPEGKDRKKSAQRRRLIWLRCQAAGLLAKGRTEYKPLLDCDPQEGRDFQLAQLKVLDSERIQKDRLALFKKRTESEDPVIAQAALRLIASHPEIEESAALLLQALQDEDPGTVATAAQVISAYPARAHGKDEDDTQGEKIITQLKKILEAAPEEVPAETRAAAIKAGGALAALSLKPSIEKFCNDEVQAFWEPAARALSMLGNAEASCPKDPPKSDAHPPPPISATLIVDSDVGELGLHVDGRDAPASAAHFLKLVEDGFYSDISVHAARPGFAIQFGDKDGDGYQDQVADPLPHEVSPEPFSALTFGMSAFSPGSQDSQIFVVVSDAPQLLGSRVRLGKAEGPWHLLTVGDRIHSIKKKP